MHHQIDGVVTGDKRIRHGAEAGAQISTDTITGATGRADDIAGLLSQRAVGQQHRGVFTQVDAENGAVAMERLKTSEKLDIALVDWNMPEMNGYEFVCEVRKDDAYKDLPLMMVTTETEMSQVVKALEAGANEYVMKPFTKEMITEKLTLMGVQAG